MELSDNNTRARVLFKIKRTIPVPGMAGQLIELPGVSTWKLENGDWFWYVAQKDQSEVVTPFGAVRANGGPGGAGPALPPLPDLASLQRQVSLDRTSVVLSAAAPVQTVTVVNALGGAITISVQADSVAGLVVDLDPKQIPGHGKGTLLFRAKPGMRPAGKVGIDVQPLGQHFDVTVSSE